jgi:ABC-type uncharacterized transport system substrate-binding protein
MLKFIATALCFFLLLPRPAADAHPHVWVTIKSQVLFGPDGSIVGIRHAWAFDDMFSAFATQGIAQKTKGVFTREELASLAEVNVTSLKEYAYFTFAKADGQKVQFEPPKDYWLDYKDAFLTLNFTLPLKTPVRAKSIVFEVFDETYFVAFDLDQKLPAVLDGAPANCKVTTRPPQELTAAQAKRLSELDATQQNVENKLSDSFASKINVTCP